MPSRLPEAPSVTQTATHIGDLGTRRRGNETMRPAVGRPPHGKMPAAGSRREQRLEGKGRPGAGGDGPSVLSAGRAPSSGARSREPAAVPGRPVTAPSWKTASPGSSRGLELQPRPRAFVGGWGGRRPQPRGLGVFGLQEKGQQ